MDQIKLAQMAAQIASAMIASGEKETVVESSVIVAAEIWKETVRFTQGGGLNI